MSSTTSKSICECRVSLELGLAGHILARTSSPPIPEPLKMNGLMIPGAPEVLSSTDIFSGAIHACFDAMTMPPVVDCVVRYQNILDVMYSVSSTHHRLLET